MSEDKISLIVSDNFGERLDVYLSLKLEKTRSYIKKLLDDGKITVNGKIVKSGYKIKADDKISAELREPEELNVKPAEIELDIVYEDEYLAVINKPQGMVVHPAPGNYDDTLVNALLYNLKSLSSINGVIRPGIVHRLDKDTSGLLVVAKTDEAHVGLSRQIAEKSAERIYRAVVDGRIAEDKITVNKPIARNLKDRKKMAIRADGKKAVTHISVLKRYKNYTYIECKLETGRTHQIRVHLKSLHHPVIGDYVYGGSDKFNLNGQLLHAYKLSFVHPITNERMTFTAELPEYFKDTLENLEKGEQL